MKVIFSAFVIIIGYSTLAFANIQPDSELSQTTAAEDELAHLVDACIQNSFAEGADASVACSEINGVVISENYLRERSTDLSSQVTGLPPDCRVMDFSWCPKNEKSGISGRRVRPIITKPAGRQRY